jgi:hypothetical protein
LNRGWTYPVRQATVQQGATRCNTVLHRVDPWPALTPLNRGWTYPVEQGQSTWFGHGRNDVTSFQVIIGSDDRDPIPASAPDARAAGACRRVR